MSRSLTADTGEGRERTGALRLVGALACVVLSIWLLLSLWGYHPADNPGWTHPSGEEIRNPLGRFGATLSRVLFGALGMPAAYLLVLLAAIWSTVVYFRGEVAGLGLRLFGCGMLVAGTAALDGLLAWPGLRVDVPPGSGGVLGAFLAGTLRTYFGTVGPYLVTLPVLFCAFILATDAGFVPFLREGWAWFRARRVRRAAESAEPVRQAPDLSAVRAALRPPGIPEPVVRAPPPIPPLPPSPASPEPAAEETPRPPREPKPKRKKEEDGGETGKAGDGDGYVLPARDKLDPPAPWSGPDDASVRERAAVLERALAQFGIESRVVSIDRGPVITQYELELGAGIKVHKVLALNSDIAMAMRATSIRIEAPIPGRSTVGIEVPNPERGIVRLRELIEAVPPTDFSLPFYLGRDASGGPLVADLAKMPHLLVAGATGSGKTVCLQAAIVSLLMAKRPDEVKLILVDPKAVELAAFRDIPHLMAPVVTDSKKAATVLDWAVRQMDERYDLLSRAGVRHIDSYNRLGVDEIRARLGEGDPEAIVPERLPYVVIVVDELADLMLVSAKEVEVSITRLAQKSRSVGIHVVLATQRPSVDVITGLIKSNLPARIAFQVPSKVDSRTILDRNGADRLLGGGDMLYLGPGASKVVRAQGAFVSEEEVARVVGWVRSHGDPEYDNDLMGWKRPDEGGGASGGRDDLYAEAVQAVVESQRGSASLLQRQFAIGYTRAQRLIDEMERDGIVGPYKGSQAREVLITPDEWERATRSSS